MPARQRKSKAEDAEHESKATQLPKRDEKQPKVVPGSRFRQRTSALDVVVRSSALNNSEFSGFFNLIAVTLVRLPPACAAPRRVARRLTRRATRAQAGFVLRHPVSDWLNGNSFLDEGRLFFHMVYVRRARVARPPPAARGPPAPVSRTCPRSPPRSAS